MTSRVRNRRTSSGGVVCLVLLSTCLSLARGLGAQSRPSDKPATLISLAAADSALFARYDITEDGWLSGTELAACQCQRYDTGATGEVTLAAFLAGRARDRAASGSQTPPSQPPAATPPPPSQSPPPRPAADPTTCPAGTELAMPWERMRGGAACTPVSGAQQRPRDAAGTLTMPYKVGDRVDAMVAGQWFPGTVIAIDGAFALVRYTRNRRVDDDRFGLSSLRAATLPALPQTPVAATTGAFVVGAYTCTQGLYNVKSPGGGVVPKGTIDLRADGTYQYLNGSSTGRYRYDAASGRLTWLSGYFTQGGDVVTTFAVHTSVAQLDMTFTKASGPLYWTCGHNLR